MSKMDIITAKEIANKIYTVRSSQVMLDRDLADLYRVETRAINQAVKRNADRFPPEFLFQLTENEFLDWKSQTVMSNPDKMGLRRPPFVFTEQGVAMLSSVLRSEVATMVSIQIMRAFVSMRKFLIQNASVFQRIDHLELGQPQSDKGIFFDGQIFDAYSFVAGLIKKANTEIILIDNYVDETVLTLLDKRKLKVAATIYTKSISKALQLDVEKHSLFSFAA